MNQDYVKKQEDRLNEFSSNYYHLVKHEISNFKEINHLETKLKTKSLSTLYKRTASLMPMDLDFEEFRYYSLRQKKRNGFGFTYNIKI